MVEDSRAEKERGRPAGPVCSDIPPGSSCGADAHTGTHAESSRHGGNNLDSISQIIDRRNRLLNHIRREQFLICFPSTLPFQNEHHALESLLPYHLFAGGTLEDFLFANTVSVERSLDVDAVVRHVSESICATERSFAGNRNMILDLMDLEAHRFILNKYAARADSTAPSACGPRRQAAAPQRGTEKKRSAVVRLRLSREELESHRYVRAVNEKLFFRREQ
uniref:GLTSCR protein conserved domain-containing protein n=1 Tax=Antonospora locustae TaxID=278021 RepID=Q6E6G7_ANTLO|nr:hypothetical protein [Antonospora locustae]|eukprot:jgi/Antlo1/1936/714